MRLEAEGQAWTLPPTRAAMIVAGQPVLVTLPTEVVARSVLFDEAFIPAPASALTVVTMTPLARELVAACGAWTAPDVPLPPLARHLFLALAAVVEELAAMPSRAVMPVPTSAGLARALALTVERLAEPLRFEEVAGAVAMTPRTLARRFEAEMGMTWRGALRRLRVIRSLDLLAAGSGVTGAALAAGYASPSAFNAAFREVMGETPTSYRKSVVQLGRLGGPHCR